MILNGTITKIVIKFFNYFIFFLYYIFVFIIFYFIFLNFYNYFYPKNANKFIFFNINYISSNSMSPEYKKNDLIIVKKITKDEILDLKEGDDVVFYIEEQFQTNRLLRQIPFVCHRVQYNNKNERFITTKGINNNKILDFEKRISYENVAYKIIYTIPLSNIMREKKSYLSILGYIILILSILFLIFNFKNSSSFKFIKNKFSYFINLINLFLK